MRSESRLNDQEANEAREHRGLVDTNPPEPSTPKPTKLDVPNGNPIINGSSILERMPINKTKENKLFEVTVTYKNRWERIAKEFPGFGISELKSILVKIVKRALNKVNRENDRIFHPSQINGLKMDFVVKIFNTMIRKRKQEYEEGYLDLLDTFRDFAFLDNARRRQRMSESQKKLMKNFLVKVVETSKKEETRLGRIKKEYINLEKEAVKEFCKTREDEESKYNTEACLIDDSFYCSLIRKCLKIEKVCTVILSNQQNRFKQTELDMYRRFLAKKKEGMQRRTDYVQKYGQNKKVHGKLCETLDLMERSQRQLETATIIQVVEDINELFMKSDSETKQGSSD